MDLENISSWIAWWFKCSF